MIIGGMYPGGYTPLGTAPVPVAAYHPKYGALRVSLTNAIAPAIGRILNQFGVDCTLYIADRATRALDGSTANGAWQALPDVAAVTINTVKEADKIRAYGADLDVDAEAYMALPKGVSVRSLPGMGLVPLVGLFATVSFRIVEARPIEVGGIVKLALVRLKTPIVAVLTLDDVSGAVLE